MRITNSICIYFGVFIGNSEISTSHIFEECFHRESCFYRYFSSINSPVSHYKAIGAIVILESLACDVSCSEPSSLSDFTNTTKEIITDNQVE